MDLSLYKDESQLKRRKGLHNEKPSQRKKSKRAASSTDDDADEEESDRIRKTSKASRVKKRSVNKALAIAKSVAKGTSRAERALNRSTKSGNSLGNDIVTTTAAVTTTATITTTITTTAAVATTTTTATTAAAAASVTTTTTSTTVNPATNVSTVADAKNNAESKKLDLKKNGKQQSNNSIRGVPRTKLGGK